MLLIKNWYMGTSMRAELGAYVYNNLASNYGNLQAGNLLLIPQIFIVAF